MITWRHHQPDQLHPYIPYHDIILPVMTSLSALRHLFHWPCDATLPSSRPWPASLSPVQRLVFHVHCVPGIVQVLLAARVRSAGRAEVQGPGGFAEGGGLPVLREGISAPREFSFQTSRGPRSA